MGLNVMGPGLFCLEKGSDGDLFVALCLGLHCWDLFLSEIKEKISWPRGAPGGTFHMSNLYHRVFRKNRPCVGGASNVDENASFLLSTYM